MEDFTAVASSVQDALKTAQALQETYDAVGWQIKDLSYAKVRHIMIHLINITAELSRLVEDVEHRQYNSQTSDHEVNFDTKMAANGQISANLLFHALQLASLSGADIGEELLKLYRSNASRFAPASEFARLPPRT